MASYLAVLEGLWLLSGRSVYLRLFTFWVRIFAIAFGMGVVSGIVMSYQFGTNWSVFSDRAGPIVGPLMGYEVLSAFFLEAGFLGIMLFGRQRVGRGVHFAATLIVAAGSLLSAFWILSVNSWMQTPAGYAVNEAGQFVPADWLAVIFNPSFPYRLVHMVLASYLATAFAVGAVGAWHLLRRPDDKASLVMFSMAMGMAILVTPLQIAVGDLHGLNTLRHQPAKIAALEGHFETRAGAPLILFGWPDMAAEETRFAIGIPKLGSIILARDSEAVIKGLKEWPRDERPNATIVFWSFRLMVLIGFLMMAVGLWGLIAWRAGGLTRRVRLLRAAIVMGPSGFIAILAGWITTEVGRQPYTIYGLLRTAESMSPVEAPAVSVSLLAYVVVYLLVFGAGVVYLIRLMMTPPDADLEEEPQEPLRTAAMAHPEPRGPGAGEGDTPEAPR